ncbi:MAG TPA: hypothetical protein VEA16_07880 [Vicinamibacterales bacterium]|nr:hypothetical protein [Vicinamibacterales bacterium]
MAANPPTTHGDIGTVKDALKTLLTGPDFERELVTVEARFGDGLTVPRVPGHEVKTSEREGVPAQFPTVEIVGEVSDPDQQVDYADLYGHAIAVIVWMNGDDEETVTKLVERYLLAVRKTIRSESLMPMIGCRPVVRGREQYGVVGRKSGLAHPFVKAGSISFTVATIEA